MVELSGSLAGMELMPMVGLLSDLRQTGSLQLSRDNWSARLDLRDGRVVGASFADERGLSALTALGLVMHDAEFVYLEGPPPAGQELDLTPDRLRVHFETAAGIGLLALDAVPRPGTGMLDHALDDDQVVLHRSTVQRLLAIDGRRTLGEIVGARPSSIVLLDLARLVELGLLQLAPGPWAPANDQLAPTPVQASLPPSTVAQTAPATPRTATAPLTPAPPSSVGLSRKLPEYVVPSVAIALMLLALGAVFFAFVRPPEAAPRVQALQPIAAPTVEAQPTGLEPTLVPTAQTTIAPTRAPVSATPLTSRTSTNVVVQPAARPNAAGSVQLLDAQFFRPRPGWAERPPYVVWADGAYRLAPSTPGRFVAVGAPLPAVRGDVVVSASLRKVGGPSGGGYGLIVRDQEPAQRDGWSQSGHFYVFEVGDRSELGVWRRDGDRWIDLVSWMPSSVVRPGSAANELSVRIVGDQMVFVVNGTEVTTQTDTALFAGGVGLFAGGDYNDVAVDRFSAAAPGESPQ